MIAPTMSYTTLANDYLAPNGYKVEKPQPQDFWDEHDRIYVVKGELRFPLQYRTNYNYLHVIHLLRDLEIEAPEEFKVYYDEQRVKWEAKRKKSEEADGGPHASDENKEP